MAPQIPDRWLKYQPIGQRIEGTRFIAFKVPLREQVNKAVRESDRLHGDLLLERVPNLGVIIDLTNTNRYYDPKFFSDKGVEHKKLMIPGHLTPPESLVNRFKDLVKQYIQNNIDNDKLIGVHCTHGVNRTGYLICNYMVSEMSVDPVEAIKKFAEARGHQIERQNYVESLHTLTAASSQHKDNAPPQQQRVQNGYAEEKPTNRGNTERSYANKRDYSRTHTDHRPKQHVEVSNRRPYMEQSPDRYTATKRSRDYNSHRQDVYNGTNITGRPSIDRYNRSRDNVVVPQNTQRSHESRKRPYREERADAYPSKIRRIAHEASHSRSYRSYADDHKQERHFRGHESRHISRHKPYTPAPPSASSHEGRLKRPLRTDYYPAPRTASETNRSSQHYRQH